MLYRRRIGRWLTDVTPLLPLLTSQKCHFHLQTAPWALTWTPSLTLRFPNSTPSSPLHPHSSIQTPQGTDLDPQPMLLPGGGSMHFQSRALQSHSTHELLSLSLGNSSNNDSLSQESLQQPASAPEPVLAKLKPQSILPLFEGGEFDAGYNSKYKPVEFPTPHGTQKALLEAVVTGAPRMWFHPLFCAADCSNLLSCTLSDVKKVPKFTQVRSPGFVILSHICCESAYSAELQWHRSTLCQGYPTASPD